MKILEAEELTWDRLREEAHKGSLFILSVAPLEDHASHLPSGTDPIICQALAYRVAELLPDIPVIGPQVGEINVVMLPAWYQGASALASLGCLRFSRGTLLKALVEYGSELAGLGVRRLVLLSSHGADSHMQALDKAATWLERNTRMRVASPSGSMLEGFLSGDYDEPVQRYLGRSFTEAEAAGLKGDVHGAGWETSLLLYLNPELVDRSFRHLPPHPVPKGTAKRLRALRAHRGYFGTPHVATAELGEAAFEVMSKQAAATLTDFCNLPVRHHRKVAAHAKRPTRQRPREHAGKLLAGLAVGVLLFWLWDRPRPVSF
jgi:creatinine amidohydrolase/Fe(II)-dependent formamide hydrolase-like protein